MLSELSSEAVAFIGIHFNFSHRIRSRWFRHCYFLSPKLPVLRPENWWLPGKFLWRQSRQRQKKREYMMKITWGEVAMFCYGAIHKKAVNLHILHFVQYSFPKMLTALAEFPRGSLVVDHFLYSFDHKVWFRCDIIRRN